MALSEAQWRSKELWTVHQKVGACDFVVFLEAKRKVGTVTSLYPIPLSPCKESVLATILTTWIALMLLSCVLTFLSESQKGKSCRMDVGRFGRIGQVQQSKLLCQVLSICEWLSRPLHFHKGSTSLEHLSLVIAECTVEVPSSFSSFPRFLFKLPSWWLSRLSWINMQWKRFNVSIMRAIVFQLFCCILTRSKRPFEADGKLFISLLLNINSRNDQIAYPLSPSSLSTGPFGCIAYTFNNQGVDV